MSHTSRKIANAEKAARKTVSFQRDALHKCLLEKLESDPNIVVLASAQATHAFPTVDNLLALLVREAAAQYPPRFFGLGELLEDLVPTASDVVSKGLKPVVLMGSTDLARSYAGLAAACAVNLPVTFFLISGQIEGQTWQPHGVNDLAVLLTMPTLPVAEPADSRELSYLARLALTHEDGPSVIRYLPMDATRLILKPTLGPSLGMGKGQIIRQGKELALVALGTATEMALKVADQLHKSGHEAAVVEIPWARPLDEPLLGAVANHFRRIVTIENGALNGGFGASILELLESKDWQQVEVHRVGLNREGTDNPVKISQDIGRFLERANQSQLIKLPLSLQPRNHQA